jgi:hypothetical protein
VSVGTIRTALVALILCIAGPSFLALSARNELRARALDDHGVVTLAEVTEIAADRDTDAGQRIAYRITVGGATYEGANRHLSAAQLDVARTVGRIEVRYLPEDPSVSAPTQAATRRTQIIAFFVSGGVTFSGLALVALHVATKRKTGRWWA